MQHHLTVSIDTLWHAEAARGVSSALTLILVTKSTPAQPAWTHRHTQSTTSPGPLQQVQCLYVLSAAQIGPEAWPIDHSLDITRSDSDSLLPRGKKASAADGATSYLQPI